MRSIELKLRPAQRSRHLEVVLAVVDIVRHLARGAGIADTALANPPASMTRCPCSPNESRQDDMRSLSRAKYQ
jgi:hypothetical protein